MDKKLPDMGESLPEVGENSPDMGESLPEIDENLLKMMKRDRFAAYVGMELREARPGYALVDMDIEDKHLNGVDMIQGGVIFTLADFAFAAASNAGGQITVGIQVSISYLKASKGKKLKAEAVEVSASQKTVNYKLDVFNEFDEHIAQLTAIGFHKNS